MFRKQLNKGPLAHLFCLLSGVRVTEWDNNMSIFQWCFKPTVKRKLRLKCHCHAHFVNTCLRKSVNKSQKVRSFTKNLKSEIGCNSVAKTQFKIKYSFSVHSSEVSWDTMYVCMYVQLMLQLGCYDTKFERAISNLRQSSFLDTVHR